MDAAKKRPSSAAAQDSLLLFGRYLQQLMMESLGKEKELGR